jgi:acetylglutamate kinase
LNRAIVIKIGGSTLGSHDTTIEDLVELQQQGKSIIVVHGGGKLITDWLTKLGVSSRFVQGERVTDQATLEVVVSVLAGLVNKDIVAAINNLGGKAVGISGIDGALVEGRIKNPEMGYVGEVTRINTKPLESLLESDFLPIVAPVGINSAERPSGAPQTLNFNADIVAGEIAAAVSAENLIFLTDVAGILDKSGKLMTQLSPTEAEELVASGIASGGMIPKIRACLKAISTSPATCIIDGRKPHALIKAIRGEEQGTLIRAK